MSSIGAYAIARRGGVTLAEIDAVRGKLGSRATVAQIAKMIGRCEADVRAVLSPEAPIEAVPARTVPEQPRPQWDDRRIKLAHKMRAAGLNSAEIGEAVGCSSSSVRAFFAREQEGRADRREAEWKAGRDKFTRLWMQGATADEITAQMGWKTTKYVNQWRQKLGLPSRRRVAGSLAYAVPTKDAA